MLAIVKYGECEYTWHSRAGSHLTTCGSCAFQTCMQQHPDTAPQVAVVCFHAHGQGWHICRSALLMVGCFQQLHSQTKRCSSLAIICRLTDADNKCIGVLCTSGVHSRGDRAACTTQSQHSRFCMEGSGKRNVLVDALSRVQHGQSEHVCSQFFSLTQCKVVCLKRFTQ